LKALSQKITKQDTSLDWLCHPSMVITLLWVSLGLFFLMTPATVFGQAEQDSTSNEQTLQQQQERSSEPFRTPYQSDISNEQLEIYNLDGSDDIYTFHKRLRYHTLEDFMFRENPAYDPYGIDWQIEINTQLLMVLEETFKDQNEFLGKLARIIPFLGLGFFEEYEVPIVPRMDTAPPEKISSDN
jgi:hypothetical protein